MGKKRSSTDGVVSSSKSKKKNESKAIGTSVLDSCLESKPNRKKQKKIHKEKSEEIDEDAILVSKREYNEMKKSIKFLSETMTRLEEILPTKADLLEFSLKKNETPKGELTRKRRCEETRKKKEEAISTFCYDGEEGYGNDDLTILVSGFDNVRPRDEIKKDLSDIFASCGEVTRVFVPIECKTGSPLRFAFIDLKDGEGNDKALRLNKSRIRGSKYKVKMATDSFKFHSFPNFKGCERCQVSKFSPRYYKNTRYGKLVKPSRRY